MDYMNWPIYYRFKDVIFCSDENHLHLGPSSQDKNTISSLIKGGMNIARINLSHGSHEEHFERIKILRETCEELKANVALLLDTKGPEIRLGAFLEERSCLKRPRIHPFIYSYGR